MLLDFLYFDTPTTEISAPSLPDALPICARRSRPLLHHAAADRAGPGRALPQDCPAGEARGQVLRDRDRKSTRLNSSHTVSSYGVSRLKKKPSLAATARP